MDGTGGCCPDSHSTHLPRGIRRDCAFRINPGQGAWPSLQKHLLELWEEGASLNVCPEGLVGRGVARVTDMPVVTSRVELLPHGSNSLVLPMPASDPLQECSESEGRRKGVLC